MQSYGNILYQIIASLVKVHNEVWFINNETPDVEHYISTHLDKVELTTTECLLYCRIGASIVVSTQTFPSVFNKLINNPQCFLLYHNPGVPFSEIHDVRSILMAYILFTLYFYS